MSPRLFALVALPAILAACGPSQPATPVKSAEALKAELPAPFSGGDVAAGNQLFAQCVACHTVNEGGANMVGPNLYGVFGTKAGTRRADFAYSEALKSTGWTWDAARLDTWLADPKADVPGTKMAFVGLKDPKQRIDVIAYLKVASSGGPQ